jgi:hypothetical protein
LLTLARCAQDGRPIYIEQLGKLDIKALYNVCVSASRVSCCSGR